MRLDDLDVIVTAPPAPGWGGRYWILVKVTTDDGITGWGECYASSVGPDAMAVVIRDVFERHMHGEDPANVEKMFRRAYSSGFTQRPDLTVIGAFSGLEIACWDILGKARDCPVWTLLGGRMNDRVRAYSYLYPLRHHELPRFWGDADMAAESALFLADQGYTAVKFDPAGPYTMRGGHHPSRFDIETSVQFCARIREAVGPRADILFGTHGQFNPAGAIRIARAIEPYDPLWFEEPVPPDAPEALGPGGASDLDTDRDGRAADDANRVRGSPFKRRGDTAAGTRESGRNLGRAENRGPCRICRGATCAASLRGSGGMGGEPAPVRLDSEPPDCRNHRDGVSRQAHQGRDPGRGRLCPGTGGSRTWHRGGRGAGA